MQQFRLIILFLILSLHGNAQFLVKDYDLNFGGTSTEYNVAFIKCSQGGFAMLAASSSDSSFSKSQSNRDSTGFTMDYWLVRFDAQGTKLWDRTYGGVGSDMPSAIIEMPNGDFILAGSSSSSVSYEKSEPSRGGDDFWILRVNSAGNVLWDKTIGGSGGDFCKSVMINAYGNIFSGGYSLSAISGDKTTPAIGTQSAFDFWLVVLTQNGQIMFDQTLGGIQNDNCISIVASSGGGAIMMGYSDSPVGFSKSQAPRGLYDYWVISIDSVGKKIWDRTLGGAAEDYGYCALKTADAIYVGGDSYSLPGFDKTALNKGVDDMWLVKLSLTGNILWDHSYGSLNADELNMISQNSDGSILLSGESYSVAGFDKSENNMGAEQLWMIQVDTAGNKLMDKTFFSMGHDEEGMALESSPGNYMGCISSIAGVGGYKSMMNFGFSDVWVCALKPAVGIAENSPMNFILYPNPNSSGQLNLLSKYTKGTIEFYDAKGALLKEEKLWPQSEMQFDISSFNAGIYLVKISGDFGIYTHKLIVEKH